MNIAGTSLTWKRHRSRGVWI